MIVDLVVDGDRPTEEDVKRELRGVVRVPASFSVMGCPTMVKQIGVGGVREGVLPEREAGA